MLFDNTNMEVVGKYSIERYVNQYTNRIAVRVYNNNATRNPLVHNFGFSSEEQRETWVTKFKASNERVEAYKAERKAARQSITATPDLVGKIFRDSWGYDMTINDYIKVVEVKSKTVKAVRVSCKIEDDNGRGNGRSTPDAQTVVSEPFQLSVRPGYGNGIALVGQYPYGSSQCGTRKGHFSECKSNESHYYNTWD